MNYSNIESRFEPSFIDPAAPSQDVSALTPSYSVADIGNRIQQLRKGKGMTQEQLAESLNISAVHLKKAENGKRGCSLDLLTEVAIFFGVSLDFLVFGKLQGGDLRMLIDSTILALENLRQNLGGIQKASVTDTTATS